MIQTTKDIGSIGEQMAAELLASKGYAIIERNSIVANVEVDIIAAKGNRLIMVEVKTRRESHLDDNFGLDINKMRRLARAADSYVRIKNLPHEVQIDAVLVTNKADGTSSIEHLEDIALPPRRSHR